MRKLCTILSALALVVLCAVLMPTEAQAAEVVESGTCGENLTWTLDGEGTLTILGTGAMPNYPPGMYTPWMDYAESVTSIVIKDGVTTIGYGAFSGFANLTSVSIPASVTNIGANAFANCSNLAAAIYYGTDTQWSTVSVSAGNTYLTAALRISIATGSCGADLIWTLDDVGTLTIFGTGAMTDYSYNGARPWGAYLSSIKQIIITNGVTSIGSSAFYKCSNLTSVSISNGVTTIGSSAFEYCSSLTSITIPESVTTIHSAAFVYCNNLTDVYITDLAAWCKIDYYGAWYSTPLEYAGNLHLNGKLVTDLVIPEGVTEIKGHAFEGCSLTSVTIPSSVTSIGDDAFCGCTNLTDITIGNGVTNIGAGAFKDCSMSSVTIPGSVTSVGYMAFGSCDNLISATINDGATHIGRYMFYGCTQLTTVSVPDSITSIAEAAFSQCDKLTYNLYGNGKYLGNATNPYACLMELQGDGDLIIPSGVKYIHASYKNATIADVYISDLAGWCNISFGRKWNEPFLDFADGYYTYGNPLSYAQNLYLDGKMVTHLSIPNGVTEIKDHAFMGFEGFTSLNVPTSVISIGQEAFSGCTGLTVVTYCGTPEQWNQISIESGNTVLENVLYNSHSWTSITVTKQPTYTSMGESRAVCALCGEVKTETIPAKFYGTSINLGNTLDMYFGFYTGLVDEAGKVVFVREFADGTTETTEAPITAFNKNNSVYDITYTGLAAKEMCDTIHVYVYNSDGTLVGQHSDSIRSYILRQLREKDYGAEFRTLCVDLLNYGAAAQETFGYNTNDLANKDLTAEELAEGTQIVAAYTNKQAVTGTTAAYYGTAYLLETKISMTMAVRGSYFGNGCYALVSYTDHTGTEKNNIRLEGKKNNSVYEFVLNEIVVADGRCLLTIEFYKADGTKVLTVQDSMESYTARNADIYPLAEKMLAFSDSAYKYLHRTDSEIVELNVDLLQSGKYVAYELIEDGELLMEYAISQNPSIEENVMIFHPTESYYYAEPSTAGTNPVQYGGKTYYGGDGGFGGYWLVVSGNTLEAYEEWNAWLYADSQSNATYAMQRNGDLILIKGDADRYPYLWTSQKS